jgi:hypothetical protein
LLESATPLISQDCFKECGLVPWNPTAVDFSKLHSTINVKEPKKLFQHFVKTGNEKL